MLIYWALSLRPKHRDLTTLVADATGPEKGPVMSQDVTALLHSRYPVPAPDEVAFLQQYWDQLAALGEHLDQGTLGPAEIAVTYDPAGAVDD